jgi:hypothetical protein
MSLTPEQRGIRWPRNFLEDPLPKPVPNDSKRGHTGQGYEGIHGKFEQKSRHVNNSGDAQLRKDATSLRSI